MCDPERETPCEHDEWEVFLSTPSEGIAAFDENVLLNTRVPYGSGTTTLAELGVIGASVKDAGTLRPLIIITFTGKVWPHYRMIYKNDK